MVLALKRRSGILLAVVLPLVLTAIFLFGIAADQYASEARFLIRARQEGGGGGGGGGIAEMMAKAGGGPSGSAESLAVRDYLLSIDAVNDLRKKLDLVAIWRRPESDPVLRLLDEDPPAEVLLRYFRQMVTVVQDPITNVTVVTARAFRPADAQAITENLLQQAEGLVNSLSERSRTDTLNTAREEVRIAEERVLASQQAVTQFRQTEFAVDPAKSAEIGLTSLGGLEQELTKSRAELQEKQVYMRPDNPQIVNLRNRVAALERQIDEDRRRMTVGTNALPSQLAAYERLMLERDFADKQLASATASQELARIDARRQQLYLARVVQPSMPQYALYPRRLFILGGIAAVLLVLYGIGWLLAAGVRDHVNK
jgi:capsular polysaccharide transport system permease protein